MRSVSLDSDLQLDKVLVQEALHLVILLPTQLKPEYQRYSLSKVIGLEKQKSTFRHLKIGKFYEQRKS
jgi:hypothetical protein